MGLIYENGTIIIKPDNEIVRPNPDNNAYQSENKIIATAAQAKILLYRKGLLEKTEKAVEQYPGDVQLWFKYALHWESDNVYIWDIGLELGLSDEEIYEFIREASEIII